MRHPTEAVVTRHSPQPKNFGTRLRWRRARRRLSQLDLAGAAGISQRHLSFLEVDRTIPSQEMALRLAAALDLPLRRQNAPLLAAGFAPYWHESPLATVELTQISRALDFMLAQQEPFPAFVVDRRWNLMCANAGAARLTQFLMGAQASEAAKEVNLADALVSPVRGFDLATEFPSWVAPPVPVLVENRRCSGDIGEFGG